MKKFVNTGTCALTNGSARIDVDNRQVKRLTASGSLHELYTIDGVVPYVLASTAFRMFN